MQLELFWDLNADARYIRLINVFAVKWYGESEFWLALGKVILIIGLLVYTYVH